MISNNRLEPNPASTGFSLPALFSRMRMGAMLRRCGFSKRSGASPADLLSTVLVAVLSGCRNIWEFFESRASLGCGASRDAAYRFLKDPRHNWDARLPRMAAFACGFCKSLEPEDEKRVHVLIADDTPIERPRVKKCQCAFRLHNHVSGRKFKGYLQLSIGWSDGVSHVPVADAITGSLKASHAVAQRQAPSRDGRTASARARADMASKTKPQVLLERVGRALKAGIDAQCLLVDSWYFSDDLFAAMEKMGLGVITMAKSSVMFGETKGCRRSSQERLRARAAGAVPVRKQEVLAMIAFTKAGRRVRLMFVTKRGRPGEFITLVCTDCSLAAEEIIRLYSRRWMIEIRFKAQKQWLGLGSECQGRLFETVHSQMIISSMRYMLLELNRRIEKDPRSFFSCCRSIREEMREIPYREALHSLVLLISSLPKRLLDKGIVTARQAGEIEDVIIELLGEWLSGVYDYIRQFMGSIKKLAAKSKSHLKEPERRSGLAAQPFQTEN